MAAEHGRTEQGRSSRAEPGSARAQLDRLVRRAGLASLFERVWPLVWRALIVGLVFLAASWLGLWLDLAPVGRMAGLGLFALLLVAALAPLVRLPRPTRRQSLARIDREAARDGGGTQGLAHAPASSIEDTLAVGQGDPATRALWALHQNRAAATITRLRAGRPRPDMPRHDPRAVRAGALVAALAALFVAGPEWRERVAVAFDWQAPPPPGPNFRVDGWIDPPVYTRLPPLIIAAGGVKPGSEPLGEQRLRAPVNSTLIVRIAGNGQAELTPNAALQPIAKDEAVDGRPSRPAVRGARADLREERFRLVGGTAELTIATSGAEPQRLVVETIPDLPPEVEQVGKLEVNGRGTFNLTYKARDDYGIASAEGLVEAVKPGRSLVPPPRIALALPPDATGASEVKTLVDLTDHPWSGAKVRLTLVVKDEAGQEGRNTPREIVLPGRVFTKALARALAEERRRLVTAPDSDRKRVETALDALLIAPDRFTPEPGIFLGLRTASSRLRAAKTDADLTEVADLLWEMALKIEDGDLSDAEKALRAAQDRLKEAMERGASDQEMKKLSEDLKNALDRFMKEMAERQQKNQQGQQPQQSQPQQQGQKSVTPDQLNKMLQDMQEAMKRGDTAEAQRLLEELRNILENLQTAENQQPGNQKQQNELNKQMQELDQMSRDQQQLRDETFKDSQQPNSERRPRGGQKDRQQQGGREQGQRGQPGQKGQQKGEPGQQGETGQQPGGDPQQQQQALRKRLEDLQKRMKEQGLKGEEGLSDAEQAMREAEGALQRGQGDQAVDAQGRALEGLKRGAEGLQQQGQEMAQGEGQGEQEGGQQPSQQGQAGQADDDPLGRPTRGKETSDGRVKVPGADESAVQRARRIMEELRRKLGDPTRPQEELDYFERLLRRN